MDQEETTQEVVNTGAETETAVSESTTEETTSQAEGSQESAVEEETENTTDDSAKSEDSTDETETEEKPKRGAEARKEQLNAEIRSLVTQRNQLKAEVETINSQAYKVPSEDELIEQINPETGDYYTRLEAKLARIEQEQQLERYNNMVADSTLQLTTEAERALQDFPMFDENNKEHYNPEIAALADEELGANLIFDPKTNRVIGSRTSPYKIYQRYAMASQTGRVSGQVEAQKATTQMLKNADNIGGGQRSETPFEKMTLAQQEAYLRSKGHDV